MMEKHTFILEINDTQDQSWQGSINWVQGQKKYDQVSWQGTMIGQKTFTDKGFNRIQVSGKILQNKNNTPVEEIK